MAATSSVRFPASFSNEVLRLVVSYLPSLQDVVNLTLTCSSLSAFQTPEILYNVARRLYEPTSPDGVKNYNWAAGLVSQFRISSPEGLKHSLTIAVLHRIVDDILRNAKATIQLSQFICRGPDCVPLLDRIVTEVPRRERQPPKMYASPAAFLEVDERTIEWLVSAKLCTIKDVLDFAYRHAKLRTFRFCLQQWERTPARPMDQLGQASLSWPKGSLFAVDADWTEFVNILVSKGFAINEDALAGACGKTEVFKVLLERRRALVPASQEDSSVLTAVIPSAIDWKNMTVLKLLLDYGADVNGIRRQAGRNASVDPPASPLECAVGAGAWDFVEFLLERKASVKSSTLMEATIRRASSDGGNPEWAVKFLDKGAPLNWRTMTDAMGCSPEMFRAVATHRTGRRLLQKKGVQSRVVGIAATVGNVDALELLRTELGIDLREYKAAIIGQAREHLAVVTQYLASVGV